MAVRFLSIRNKFRLIPPLYSMLQIFRLNSENKDSIETFISDLTRSKHDKWNEMRKETINRNQSQDQSGSVAQQHLIEEIYSCIDSHDDEALEIVVDNALRKRHSLSRSAVCEALEFSCLAGNRKLFDKLHDHIRQSFEASFYEENIDYFSILNLELDLREEKNIDELIDRFEVIYRKSKGNDSLRKQIMKFYSLLTQECVERRSESAVIQLREKITTICDDTQDYQLLFNLWRKLFESFWFSDQQMASKLIAKHAPLRLILSTQLNILCFIYLRNNNTELVNRLIQIFLQFNMMKQVEALVKILFDFECWRRNMDAVLQIVQLCLKLDIQLSAKENKKFLDLMLKQKPKDEKPPAERKITIPKYRFKF